MVHMRPRGDPDLCPWRPSFAVTVIYGGDPSYLRGGRPSWGDPDLCPRRPSFPGGP